MSVKNLTKSTTIDSSYPSSQRNQHKIWEELQIIDHRLNLL